jgi:hypothetical protein
VTRSVGQTVASQKLSIVARGRQLGTAAAQMTDRDAVVRQEPDLHRQLAVIMAGAAGERMAFGCLSTGVNDDLHAATQLARSMVTSFGMSPQLGPVTIGEQNGEVFLGASLQELGSVGPRPSSSSTARSSGSSSRPSAARRSVLERNWPAVEETANALLEQETLSGVALEAVLSTVVPMPIELNGPNGADGTRPSPTTARDPRDPRRSPARSRPSRSASSRSRSTRARRSRPGASSSPIRPRVRVPHAARVAWRPAVLREPTATAGLLGIEGNASIPRGLYLFDGERWRQLLDGLRGPADGMRIAWAGPDRVVDGQRAERAASGADDHALPVQGRPGRRLLRDARHVPGPVPRHGRGDRATGRSDCWFGGVGSQDATGTGAAPSTCTGTARRCAPSTTRRGAASATSRPTRATIFESSSSAAGAEDRTPAVAGPARDAAARDCCTASSTAASQRRLRPVAPRGRAGDGAELPALDSDGQQLWTTGGGAASGPSAPAGGVVPRGPLAARLRRRRLPRALAHHRRR